MTNVSTFEDKLATLVANAEQIIKNAQIGLERITQPTAVVDVDAMIKDYTSKLDAPDHYLYDIKDQVSQTIKSYYDETNCQVIVYGEDIAARGRKQSALYGSLTSIVESPSYYSVILHAVRESISQGSGIEYALLRNAIFEFVPNTNGFHTLIEETVDEKAIHEVLDGLIEQTVRGLQNSQEWVNYDDFESNRVKNVVLRELDETTKLVMGHLANEDDNDAIKGAKLAVQEALANLQNYADKLHKLMGNVVDELETTRNQTRNLLLDCDELVDDVISDFPEADDSVHDLLLRKVEDGGILESVEDAIADHMKISEVEQYAGDIYPYETGIFEYATGSYSFLELLEDKACYLLYGYMDSLDAGSFFQNILDKDVSEFDNASDVEEINEFTNEVRTLDEHAGEEFESVYDTIQDYSDDVSIFFNVLKEALTNELRYLVEENSYGQ